ncbi:hypothetical protein ACWD5F_40610 [Streptomyces sp. NPDC002499]
MARAEEHSAMGRSRWARRRQTVRELRRSGRYGPRFRDVLSGLTGLTVAVCAGVTALALSYRAFGPVAPAAILVLLTLVAVAVHRRRRPLARRRRGYYTPEELTDLDVPELVLAVARMLRRDGWRVLPLPAQDRPALAARDDQGRLLVVGFRPVAEPLPDEEPVWRRRSKGRGRAGPDLRLVVHRGTFAARDVRWAARQGHVHLIDGTRLERWAHGTPLYDLGDTPTARALPDS